MPVPYSFTFPKPTNVLGCLSFMAYAAKQLGIVDRWFAAFANWQDVIDFALANFKACAALFAATVSAQEYGGSCFS